MNKRIEELETLYEAYYFDIAESKADIASMQVDLEEMYNLVGAIEKELIELYKKEPV